MRGLCTAFIAYLCIINQLNVYWLLTFTFINNTFECFRIPAAAALLPQVLNKDQYDYGLSLNTSLTNTCELIGIAFSGVLLAVIGPTGAVMIDTISFFLCAGLFYLVNIKGKKSENSLSTSDYRSVFKDGITYIKNFRLIKILLAYSILCNALLVPINTYLAPFINGTLSLNEQAYSTFNFALTLGICIGTFLLPYLRKHFSTRNLFLYPFYSVALYYFMMMLAPLLKDTLALSAYIISIAFLCGIGFGISCNACAVSVMKVIDPSYLSRVTAIIQAVSRAFIPLTSIFLSILSLYFSIPVIFCGFAFFTIMSITGMMFSKTLKQMN